MEVSGLKEQLEQLAKECRQLVDGTIPVDKSKALKQGVLTKQGAVVKNWKKRHCVITHGALLYFKSNTTPLPQGGLTLMDAAVTFSEGVLQVRSPVSFTSSSKGKVEEAKDRVFKDGGIVLTRGGDRFKGEPQELKDWLYQLTATKNQLVDKSILKQLVAKQAELEAAKPLTEELVQQYQAVIERIQSQVTSASQPIVDEHKTKHAEYAARLNRTTAPRKAPAPPSTPPAAHLATKAAAESSEEDETQRKPDAALTAGLSEVMRNDAKDPGGAAAVAVAVAAMVAVPVSKGKEEADDVRVRAVTRDEASDYLDMANELAAFDSIIDKMGNNSAMKPISMPSSGIEPVPEFDSASVLEEARKEREQAEAEAAAVAERLAKKKADEEKRQKEEADKRAREEAERKAEEEAKRARQEADKKERDAAEQKVQEEKARQAEKEEAERKAREEAERKAKEEAEKHEKAEAERKAKEEEDKAKAEAANRAQAEAAKRAAEEAERKAKEEEADREAKAKEEAREAAVENELAAGMKKKLDLNLEKVEKAEEEERIFCTECGVQSVQGSRFCKECGTPLKIPEPPSPRDETPEDKAARKKAAARKLIEARAAKKSPTSSPRVSPRGEEKKEEKKEERKEEKKPAPTKKEEEKKPAPTKKEEVKKPAAAPKAGASELEKKMVGGKAECDGCGEPNKADYKTCVSCGKPRKK